MDFKNLYGVSNLKEFCITCIKLILKFLARHFNLQKDVFVFLVYIWCTGIQSLSSSNSETQFYIITIYSRATERFIS